MYTIKLNQNFEIELPTVILIHAFLHGAMVEEEKLPKDAHRLAVNIYQQLDKILNDELSDEEYTHHIEEAEAGAMIGRTMVGTFTEMINTEVNKHKNEKDN